MTFWRRRHKPSEATQAARQRLESVRRDDKPIKEVTEDIRRILQRNGLGSDVVDALRLRREL